MKSSIRPVSRRVQAGFTMIELIVVIVILGILAALVVPKVMSRPDDAYTSSAQGVAGAAAAAMNLNYSGCMLTNNVVTANKCVKVSACSDVSSLLQGGLPTGYTIAAAAIGAGTAGANGVNATCTVTQTSGGATATFTGISAGN